MGEQTAIAWTDHTFNPWWGCERVSPGCRWCYAEAFAKRVGKDLWGKEAGRQIASETTWRAPLRWDTQAAKAGRRSLVFCASMADVFEDRPELVEPRARLFELIAATPNLTWQLLTKRPENVERLTGHLHWPDNTWLGTSVETQDLADERVPILTALPTPAVKFLSVEPMLGHINLLDLPRVEWVICGGESGGQRRPFDLDWGRSLRDQCIETTVPFFFKQAGGLRPGTPGPDDLDAYKQFPYAGGH